MNILAFDTSTENLSICLETEKVSFTFSCSLGFKHSENLTSEIDALLKRAGISASDLDLIVCPRGPGSFTGLRIGISTAKGISFGSGVPMVTIPTLDMMAYGLSFFKGMVVPVIDARKKRFYTALFRGTEKISEDLDLSPLEIISLLEGYDRVLLTGPDACIFAELINPDERIIIDTPNKSGYAGNLIDLGEKFFNNFGPSPDTEGPLYLRKSEAEIGITRKM